jgi:hypothetical protein
MAGCGLLCRMDPHPIRTWRGEIGSVGIASEPTAVVGHSPRYNRLGTSSLASIANRSQKQEFLKERSKMADNNPDLASLQVRTVPSVDPAGELVRLMTGRVQRTRAIAYSS